jgi:hypothetical protein
VSLRPRTNVGPYRIVAAIGAGGMGEVYRARDTRLGRDIALKVIVSETRMGTDHLARLKREAHALASLNHPNILAVYDVGTVDGVPYVVFELLEGETLRERLARGALPVRKACALGIQICSGLTAAHARGILHRDLKPANVFVTTDGIVKILDFGLALETRAGQMAGSDADTASLTAAGTVVGTPAYMSPEQARGLRIDARSDLFSLGAVLYETLTGRRAFEGVTSADVLTGILTKDPGEMRTPCGAVPPVLERVVRRCLEKDADERFQSARDLGFALDAASGTTASASLPAVVAAAPRRPSAMRAILISAGALALVGLGLLAGRALWERPLPRITPLTARRGMVDVARFTTDGQTIVYSAFWDGQPPEIFTVRAGRPGSRSLGLPSARLMGVSSRDELAILLYPAGPIWIGGQDLGTLARVPLVGGAPRPILEDVRMADWSPDGHELAVVHRVGGADRLEYPIGRVLARPEAGIYQLRVSPRGDRVAVASLDGITVYDRNGNKISVPAPRFWGVAWASNSTLWLTGAAREGSIWHTTMAGPPREVYRAAGPLRMQDASKDGRLLVHHGFERLPLRIKLPGRTRELEIAIATGEMVEDLSDDGTRLLFSAQEAAFLWSADDGPPVRLGDGYGVALSPSGRWAVTRPATPLGNALPFSLVPTGPGPTRTLPSGRLGRAANREPWFFDEGHLVVNGAEAGRPSRAYVLDLHAGDPRAVTPEGVVSIRHSAWNGTLLGMAANGTLARYPIIEGEPRALPVHVPADRSVVRASGDGRFLFLRGAGPPLPIERLDLKTGSLSPFKLLAPDDLAGVTHYLGVVLSADGETHGYHYGRYLQDLYLIEGLR